MNGGSAALADWLAERGDGPGPLFCPVNKAGKIEVRRMTAQAVWNLLQKRATEGGVRAFSPHDLRRMFVSDLLDASADIATVAKMAGHANVQTTARYDRRPEDAKRRPRPVACAVSPADWPGAEGVVSRPVLGM
jgi:integrase